MVGQKGAGPMELWETELRDLFTQEYPHLSIAAATRTALTVRWPQTGLQFDVPLYSDCLENVDNSDGFPRVETLHTKWINLSDKKITSQFTIFQESGYLCNNTAELLFETGTYTDSRRYAEWLEADAKFYFKDDDPAYSEMAEIERKENENRFYELEHFTIGDQVQGYIGHPSDVFRLVMDRRSRYWVAEPHDWEGLYTITLTGVDRSNYEFYAAQAMLILTQKYKCSKYPRITRQFWSDNIDFGCQLPGFGNQYPAAKSPEALLLYQYAKTCLDNDEAFLGFYRVLEFFLTTLNAQKLFDLLKEYRINPSAEAADGGTLCSLEKILGQVSQKESNQIRNAFAILPDGLMRQLLEYTTKFGLLGEKESNRQKLADGFYQRRNSIVHSKQKEIKNARIPGFTVDKTSRAWRALAEELAYFLILYYCYEKRDFGDFSCE